MIEGAIEVRLGQKSHRLDAGGIARLPRGIAHALYNPLTTPSRYLFIAVPAGLDQWFDAVERANADGSLDDARFTELSRQFELEWLD